MNILSVDGLKKAYDEKLLFENLSFGIDQYEKVGFIGRNGAGKSTILEIIAGIETADAGFVVKNNSAKLYFLEQAPDFSEPVSALETVISGLPEAAEALDKYHELCTELKLTGNTLLNDKISHLSSEIDRLDGWNLENKAQKMLSILGIENFQDPVNKFSGGQKKRVALAKALVSEPDLLIMDEPTNHLDADSVQWLQDFLSNSQMSIIFVTHDRYFLDAVATRIIELDDQRIFHYPGNYEEYLFQKSSRESIEKSTVEHNLSRLREELAWLAKGAKARRTKAKSKIDWIEELKNASIRKKEKKIKIELGKIFLGSRIIEAHNISKSIAGKTLFKEFTYIAKPGDRIGVIGPNGSGKSTLLRILCAMDTPDDGRIALGGTVRIGYFRQENDDLLPTQTVIGCLREIAEYIDVGVGRDRYITARELLERFMFPPRQHSSFISTLSGGEKRRLGILRTLMGNPNVLLLDEPTNDFDIQTLNALEDYLDDFYGVLIVVSHDRAFLDRVTEFTYAFENSIIKQYPGNYSYYLEKKEENERNRILSDISKPTDGKSRNNSPKRKLSYKEQREFEEIESLLPALQKEKEAAETRMNNGSITDYLIIAELSAKLVEINNRIDELEMRWLELDESVEG